MNITLTTSNRGNYILLSIYDVKNETEILTFDQHFNDEHEVEVFKGTKVFKAVFHSLFKIKETKKKETNRFDQLNRIESNLNRLYARTKNTDTFLERKTISNIVSNWENLMVQLRGYSEYRFDEKGNDLTKLSWKVYCDLKGLSPNYTLGDVLA